MPRVRKGPITDTEIKMIHAIRDYFNEHGYAPSIRDICKATDLKSASSVKYHFDHLMSNGFLETDEDIPGAPRAFRLSEAANEL